MGGESLRRRMIAPRSARPARRRASRGAAQSVRASERLNVNRQSWLTRVHITVTLVQPWYWSVYTHMLMLYCEFEGGRLDPKDHV